MYFALMPAPSMSLPSAANLALWASLIEIEISGRQFKVLISGSDCHLSEIYHCSKLRQFAHYSNNVLNNFDNIEEIYNIDML